MNKISTKWKVSFSVGVKEKDYKDKVMSFSEMYTEKEKFVNWCESQERSLFLQKNETFKANTSWKIHYVVDDKIFKFEAKRVEEDKNIAEEGCFYRHFKGGLYHLDSIAKGSEDDVDYAVYTNVATKKTYVRPLEMFLSLKPSDAPNTYCVKWRFERQG